MSAPTLPTLGANDWLFTPIVSGIQYEDPEWKPFWVYYGTPPPKRHQSRKSFLLALTYYRKMYGGQETKGLYAGSPSV